MFIETVCLLVMSLFLAFSWFPASVAKKRSFGLGWLLSNRVPPEDRELPGWGMRCERAYRNLQDFFPAFLTVVVVLLIRQHSSAVTQWGCIAFLSARILHYIVYALGWPVARAATWFVSIAALLVLYAEALRNVWL